MEGRSAPRPWALRLALVAPRSGPPTEDVEIGVDVDEGKAFQPLSSAQIPEDFVGQRLLDLRVPWHGLNDSGFRIDPQRMLCAFAF